MKNTKNNGFSLAELMIATLVISIALAAAAPTITKSLSGTDEIWKTGTKFNTGSNKFEQAPDQIYFEGPNVMVGSQRMPIIRTLKDYFKDSYDVTNYRFSPKTEKLVLFNSIANPDNGNSFMASSHLSFYNDNGKPNPVYAGRLASDRYNLALGIGTLQSLVPNYENIDELYRGQYNTAIGQYALLTNATGSYNTAIGYKALQGTPASGGKATTHPSNNVAIGDNALRNNVGTNNIAIGSYAGADLEGSNNIVIGNGAGNKLTGSNNLLINSIVSFNPNSTDVKKLLIGHRNNSIYPVITDDDNFSIGVLDARTYSKYRTDYVPAPIQGFTRTVTLDKDTVCPKTPGCADGVLHAKGLIINTNRFNIKGRSKPNKAWNASDLELRNVFSVETDVADSAASSPYATDAILPCNGAAVCLTKFNIATASYFTSGTVDTGIAGNQYNRTTTFPRYNVPTNRTQFPKMPVYDLFLGSLNIDNAYLQAENKRVSVVNKDNQHSGNAVYIIDVGQARHNSGLANAIRYPSEPIPDLLDKKKSMKIRTVKMAMNFEEEFKETSGAIDHIRSNFKDFIRCFINREDEYACINTGNTANEKTLIQKILSPEVKCQYFSNSEILSLILGCPTSSDIRLKNVSGDSVAGLKDVKKLNVVNYTYKADKAKTPHVGVIAQDLKTVFPNAVKKDSDGYYKIRQEDMFYAMVNSIQELSDKNTKLEASTVNYIDKPLAELQKQNASIKAQNELLKQKNSEMEKRLSKLETK